MTEEGHFWSFNYGGVCTDGLPPRPAEETRPMDGPSDGCDGYVCKQGRCRQCIIDEDCKAGSEAYRCLYYPDVMGHFRCGDPEEYQRNPSGPRSMPRSCGDAVDKCPLAPRTVPPKKPEKH